MLLMGRENHKKLAKVLHDLYVALPALQSLGNAESIRKHLLIIEYYNKRYDEALTDEQVFQPTLSK